MHTAIERPVEHVAERLKVGGPRSTVVRGHRLISTHSRVVVSTLRSSLRAWRIWKIWVRKGLT